MTLSVGKRLGPYEVIGPLGAGGMGEVYRARDTRLGREVAIKVLPAALGSDPDRLKRFEREARSASALNHPNIVTIYDIGSADSVSYIAMERVNGGSLRMVLSEGALPVRRLLQIGAQIAEGLAKAHAAGIVHRDLKPENVMVTEDGLVKILDFGLAKLTQPDTSGGTATMSPTVSGATQEGIILGTVGYMSPEQAVGGAIDFRSDQFSFGSILYEMATGRRAYQRGSAPQTLAAIIQEEPEAIATLSPTTPAAVRWITERCLAKEPRNRYTSTDDLAKELATVRDHLSEATSAIGPPQEGLTPARWRRRFWIPAAFAAGLLAALLGGAIWRLRHLDEFWKSPFAGARFTRFTDWEGSEVDADISPDGKFVAFLSDRDGLFDAWVGQVGGGESQNLTKGKYPELFNQFLRNVGFSADGAHVWIRINSENAAKNSIWFVPTTGGVPQPFLPNAGEVAWSPEGNRIAYQTSDNGDPLFIADRSGRNPRQIFIDKKGIHNHYPTWSPDGRFIYFVQGLLQKDTDIWRVSTAGSLAERLTNHHSRVAYPTFLDERTLIYCAARPDGSGSGLWALDVERRTPHLLTAGVEEYKSIAASTDGRRLVATVANPIQNLWMAPILDHAVDDTGISRLRLPTVRAAAPRFGPDFILYLSSKGGANGLWKFKDSSETELWKGSDGAVIAAPAVSPDGSRIAFAVRGEKQASLYVMSVDGSGARQLAQSLDVADAPSWSPDGKWIAIVATEGKASPLFKVPVDGGPPVRLADGANSNPVWSPDGRFILYSEYEEAAVNRLRGVTPDKQPFALPEFRVRYQGNRYRFLPDGKALVVMRGEQWRQNLWLLDLATGAMRQLTNLKPLGVAVDNFDVSPDGKQILFDGYRENSDVVLIDLPPR